mgnify:FL=1
MSRNYYLKFTLLVDEPIEFTVFKNVLEYQDTSHDAIFENEAFTIDVNSHMLDYFTPEHIGAHMIVAVKIILPKEIVYKICASFCEPLELVNGDNIFISYNDVVVLEHPSRPLSKLEFDECDVPGFVQNYIKNVRLERIDY